MMKRQLASIAMLVLIGLGGLVHAQDTTAPAAVTDLAATIEAIPGEKLTPVSVSASSQYNPDYGAANAIDGDGGTLWVSANQGYAGITQYITLDLGESKHIEKVRLQAPVSGDAWNYGNFPSDFTVEVSTDNLNWTTVITETGYTATSGSWFENTFSAHEARYVRFVADTTQVNTWPIYTIRVAEFEVYSITENKVKLTWTAPGDDGNTGTATSYDLRYSTTGAIDDNTKWSAATVITGLPAPQVAGSAEMFTILLSNFSAGETVHFNLTTSDEEPNESGLANTDANVTIPPDVKYTISYDANGADSGTAPADQTKTDGINLILASNSGNLDIDTGDFDGWNTATDGSGTNYAVGATYSTDADLTLYAKWAQDTTPPIAITNLMSMLSYKLTEISAMTEGEFATGYEGEKTIDGDPATKWGAPTSTTSAWQYITLDLGEDKEVNKVRLLPPSDQYYNLFPSAFKIEVSTDNTNWSEMANETVYAPAQDVWYETTFTTQTVRYVRMSGWSKEYLATTYMYQVAEFEVCSPVATEVILTWTAPGDDGNIGTAASYEMRYSENGAIGSEGVWDSSTVITGLQAPQVAGSEEMFVFSLSTLTTGGKVYFNLKSTDDAGNTSDLSNSPFAVVPGPPRGIVLFIR